MLTYIPAKGLTLPNKTGDVTTTVSILIPAASYRQFLLKLVKSKNMVPSLEMDGGINTVLIYMLVSLKKKKPHNDLLVLRAEV